MTRLLDVGLIGLGPEWERRYRPALLKLRHRMRVRAIHTAVSSLAEQTAAEWQCDVVVGLRALIERSDIRAVLILDTAWYGAVPAEFACRKGKPAYLAGRLVDWVPRARELVSLAAETETPLMPDFGHRYTPATSRLKELIASRLGRPEEIILEVAASDLLKSATPGVVAGAGALSESTAPQGTTEEVNRETWLAALDWVCHLIGTAPAEVHGQISPEGNEIASISFSRSAAGGPPPTGQVTLLRQPPAKDQWFAEVRCRNGAARLHGGAQIDWEDADERRSESLTGERGGVEVMLDHFSRRVIGGLIPVPTLDDLHRAAQLASAAELRTRLRIA